MKKLLSVVLAVLMLLQTAVMAVPRAVEQLEQTKFQEEIAEMASVNQQSVVTRNDGVWLFPLPSNYYKSFTDWAGCAGKYEKCLFHPSVIGCSYISSGDDGHGGQKGHNGIDLAVPSGTAVYASAPGRFYSGGYSSSRGYYVVIEHPLGDGQSYYSGYQHLSSINSSLSNGDQVNAGDVIGYSGASGSGSGYHLHFGIVLGASGKGLSGLNTYELWSSSNPWLTTPDQTQGRIVNNPAIGSQAGIPNSETGVLMHAGSVFYTFDKNQVSIGGERITYSTIVDGTYNFNNNGYYIDIWNDEQSTQSLRATDLSKAKFEFVKDSTNDYYKIICSDSTYNYVLNVWCTTTSTDGSSVTLYSTTDSKSQRWYLEEFGGGYRIHPADATWLSLTRVEGKLFVCETVDDGYGQIWNLENANKYTISFDPNGGYVSPTSKTVTNGETYGTLPTPTRDYFDFYAWRTSDYTYITSSSVVNLTGNQTLYALWVSKDYSVPCYLDSNGYDKFNTMYVDADSKTLFGNDYLPTKKGYTFLGWSTSNTATTPDYKIGDWYTYNGEKAFYAVWSPNEYTVYFDANGGNVTTTSKNVINGTTYGTLPTPTREGYDFVGWSTFETVGGVRITSDSPFNMGEDQTLYAQWQPHTIVITFNPNGGYVSPTSKTVTNGETYGELPSPTRPGHTFTGWHTSTDSEGEKVTLSSKVNLSENQTLYAKWSANALEYNANGGTGTLPETQKANSEGKVTLSSVVPVKEGYVFKGWGIHSLAEMKVYSPGETVILPLTNTVASAVWCAESIPEEKVIVFTDDKTSVYYQHHFVAGYKDIDKTTYDNENGTINGVVSQNDDNHYDPMIYIPSLYFSVNDYNYITINAKVEAEGTEQNNVQVFFTTESNTVLSESKSMHSWFSPEDENGYRDFSFEMYLNKEWDGTITSLRIDPFNDVTGTYSIKSITLSYKSPEEMEKGIKLDKTVLNLKQGESTTITATANPADTEITWISTNEDVATVKDGVVTAVGAGSAAIIAKNYGDALIEYIAGETYTTDSPAYVSSSEDIQIVENPLNKNDKVLYLETNQADKQAWTYFWYPCEYNPGQKYLVKFRIMPGYDFYGNKVSAPSVGVNIHTNGSDKGVFWKPLAYGEWKEMACVYTVPEDIDVTKSMKFGIYANPSNAIDSEQQVSYSYYLDNIMVIPYDGKLEDGEYDGASEEFTVAAAGCLVKVKAPHTVKYNANGGTNAPETQTWFDGDKIILSSQIPVRQGYRFLGWALSPTGVVEIKPGAYLAHNDDLTLYAIWEANKYIITYDANGGKNPPANQIKTHGTALTLSLEKPTRDGYSFLGWALAFDAIEPEYVPGATYMADEQVILYAVWEKAEVVAGTIDISVSTVEAKAGDEVEIIIGVANHPGIESMEFDVEFDSTRLKYLSADLVSQKNDNVTLDEFMFFMPNFATVIDSMTISLTTGTKNLVGDGDLLKIKFKVLDNAEDGFADVMVIPNIITKIDGQTFEQQDIVPNIITNGGVEIISHLLGDLNNDGVVDLNDAILLLQHSMFPELYPLDYSGSVDFTCDGNIDLNDAILLLQYSMFPDLYPLPEDEVEEPEEDYIVKYDEAYSTGAKELRIATDPEDENNEVYYLKSDTGTTTSWTYFWLPANYKASERYVVEYDIYAVSDSLGNEIEEAYVSCGTCFSYGDFNENAGGGTTQHGSTIDGKSANVKVYPKEWTHVKYIYEMPSTLNPDSDMFFGIYINPIKVNGYENHLPANYYLDNVSVELYEGNAQNGVQVPLFDFDNAAGIELNLEEYEDLFYFMNCSYEYTDGQLVLTADGEEQIDPQFYFNDVSTMNGDNCKKIAVRFKAEGVEEKQKHLVIYFATEHEVNLSQSKSILITYENCAIDDEGYYVALIDMRENSSWNGQIVQLRIDPGNSNGVYTIDRIFLVEN